MSKRTFEQLKQDLVQPQNQRLLWIYPSTLSPMTKFEIGLAPEVSEENRQKLTKHLQTHYDVEVERHGRLMIMVEMHKRSNLS